MSAFPIEDMSNAYIEHSMVINNFVVEIGSQIKDSLCRVFGDGVQYQWRIVDWRKKSVEIYMFDYKADGTPYSYLFKVVTEKNKDELGLVMFPNFKISFDRLFDFA